MRACMGTYACTHLQVVRGAPRKEALRVCPLLPPPVRLQDVCVCMLYVYIYTYNIYIYIYIQYRRSLRNTLVLLGYLENKVQCSFF